MKQKHIQHLYWRASFGIHIAALKNLENKTKKENISILFKDSKQSTPLTLDFGELLQYKNKSYKELRQEFTEVELQKLRNKLRKKVRELNHAWIGRLQSPNAMLREKMTLFWANVFVCRDNHIFFIQKYNNTLRKHALGNFREFVKAIAKEPSMSKYLNNNQNLKAKPNENFARELMELFTLGIGNYTENDIKESARAFTGWSFKKNGEFFLRKNRHDFGEKTFLGKTGNFDGDDIINIILEQKQCARFICTKIYKYFINPNIDKKRLEEITNVFYKDYDISKVMQYIFTSKWFYDDENIGVKIKSPIELLVGLNNVIPLTFNKPQQLNYLQKMMGQVLLYPENVAGWKGGKSWIDSNTLMFRMKLPSLVLNNAVINLEEKGDFEDTFEKYYKNAKKFNKFIKTTKDWDSFEKNYGKVNAAELTSLLIASPLDKDTNNYLQNLKVKSNRNLCVQLMSIPEYQLC
ncbi:DUF1800 family protein [Polaribacter sp. R77954]|uniref:DUF1800 family protein n=1 Tax=Polaribacter sp. R77954 TaxID=3093870 RepID=UPI0037C61EEB